MAAVSSHHVPVDYTVSNLSELNAALDSAYAAGGNKTIGCVPGGYGDWRPTTRTFPAPVTITSVATGAYPQFTSLVATAWSNVILDGLEFSNSALANYSAEVVRLNVSNNVTVRNSKLRGGSTRTGRLLNFYGGDTILVEYCDLQLYGEIGLVLSQQQGTANPLTNVTVRRNSIRNGAEDCIRILGAQTHLVDECYLGEQVTTPGPHAEMIQITLDATNPVQSTGTIRNSLLIASPTMRPAGIQMTNASSTQTHGTETYDGVWVVGTQYNALWFSWTTNSTCKNCRVYNFDQGDGLFAKLVITNSTNITQFGNTAYNYATATSTFARNDAVPTTGMNLGTDLAARQAVINEFLAAFPQIPLLAT